MIIQVCITCHSTCYTKEKDDNNHGSVVEETIPNDIPDRIADSDDEDLGDDAEMLNCQAAAADRLSESVSDTSGSDRHGSYNDDEEEDDAVCVIS